MVTLPGYLLDHVYGIELHVRNLERLGCSVRFSEPEPDMGLGWFAQVNLGERILFQGPADDRFAGFSWGFVQGRRVR